MAPVAGGNAKAILLNTVPLASPAYLTSGISPSYIINRLIIYTGIYISCCHSVAKTVNHPNP